MNYTIKELQTSAQILREAAELVRTKPKEWTQNAFARDVTGNSVMIFSGTAVCWCATARIDLVRVGMGADNIYSIIYQYSLLNLPTVNDDPATTNESMADYIDKIAAYMEDDAAAACEVWLETCCAK